MTFVAKKGYGFTHFDCDVEDSLRGCLIMRNPRIKLRSGVVGVSYKHILYYHDGVVIIIEKSWFQFVVASLSQYGMDDFAMAYIAQLCPIEIRKVKLRGYCKLS